jgi:hypothetical protein
MKASTIPGYRTEDEQAALLGKNKRTLKRWRQNRVGPPVTMVGETPYYSVASTERWLHSQEQEWPQPRGRSRRAAA